MEKSVLIVDDHPSFRASARRMLEADGYEVATKKSIFGALRLYLDFINLFQSLLYLMGNRNN